MMGWCPYDGEKCHHDGYCEDCPYSKKEDEAEVEYYQIESSLTLMSFKLEKRGSRYLLKVLEDGHFVYEQLFATKEHSLLEILSYAKID